MTDLIAALIEKVDRNRQDFYWGYLDFTQEDADIIIEALQKVVDGE